MLRVAIVDDDPWVRTGRAGALRDSGRVDVVFVGDHGTALDHDGWSAVDVLLVDAHDPEAAFDHFAGVRVVERVRRECGPDQLRVVVLTGHGTNDLLRIRMSEAGADQLYTHAEARTIGDLLAIVEGTAPVATTDGDAARDRLGLSRAGRVNEAVSWADQHLDARAVDPTTPQKNVGFSRRHLITARTRVARTTGLSSAPTVRSDKPIPSWREVADFIQRARGAERR